jgi:hypothetical protein
MLQNLYSNSKRKLGAEGMQEKRQRNTNIFPTD